MIRFIVAFAFCLLSFSTFVSGQELNARVEFISDHLPNDNKRVLEYVRKTIEDYLNNRSWTGQSMDPKERINCSFVIQIGSWDGSKEFKADAHIFSTRPVYNTNYNSPVFSFRDRNFDFAYSEGEQLEFGTHQNLSSLAALLSFYAHVIIGMDQDTFRLYGSTRTFSVARNIVNYSQGSTHAGWDAMHSMDNRYWLINNLTDRKYNAYRDFLYEYHFKGLDTFSDDLTESRKEVAKLIAKLKEVSRGNPGDVFSEILFGAKSNEFVGIFNGLPINERVKVYNELVALDPTNSSKYEALR